MTPESNTLAFHRLHQSGLLLLANAWDAGSARLIESLGAKAVATTSAAVAWSHGYADGDQLPVPLLEATVAAIARVIRVPLSVDCEGGYSSDAAAVGENVARIIGAGAVGINLEDGASNPDLLCAKIEQVKRAGSRLGVNVFVNARTDTYLRGTIPVERRVAETLARAERYRAAGADGIFVPGLVEITAIRTIASSVKLPLNVLARSGLPDAAALAALGVRRLSAGSGIAEVLYGKAAALAAGFLRTGISAPLIEGTMSYRDINALMAAR
jgi:2-methylisocitrate lyase-like PEP mutase family enzyme